MQGQANDGHILKKQREKSPPHVSFCLYQLIFQSLEITEHLQEFDKTTCYPGFFGKTKKIKLQQFGIWLGKFSQLAIHQWFTRMFARGRGLAIA